MVITAGGNREPIDPIRFIGNRSTGKMGFAAETQDLLSNATKKLKKKRLHFICANDVTSPDAGFGVDTNRVTILHATGEQETLPLMSKKEVAHEIINRILPLLKSIHTD